MDKQLSKRAIEGRNWRVTARRNRRINIVVSRYVELKHHDIYTKCKNFYDAVVGKYTNVQNLTKTEEFRQMVETEQVQVSEHQEKVQEMAQVSELQETVSETETVRIETEGFRQTVETESVQVNEQQEKVQETVQISELQENVQVSELQETVSETETVQIETETVRVETETDILTEAMRGTVDMDRVVDNIIRNLEDVVPDVFNDINDEGLGLNIDDEIGSLMNEYNIDNSW